MACACLSSDGTPCTWSSQTQEACTNPLKGHGNTRQSCSRGSAQLSPPYFQGPCGLPCPSPPDCDPAQVTLSGPARVSCLILPFTATLRHPHTRPTSAEPQGAEPSARDQSNRDTSPRAVTRTSSNRIPCTTVPVGPPGRRAQCKG
jgi:hypothetical protein